jgi:hypothetical protein
VPCEATATSRRLPLDDFAVLTVPFAGLSPGGGVSASASPRAPWRGWAGPRASPARWMRASPSPAPSCRSRRGSARSSSGRPVTVGTMAVRVDLAAIRDDLRIVAGLAAGWTVMACVKADGTRWAPASCARAPRSLGFSRAGLPRTAARPAHAPRCAAARPLELLPAAPGRAARGGGRPARRDPVRIGGARGRRPHRRRPRRGGHTACLLARDPRRSRTAPARRAAGGGASGADRLGPVRARELTSSRRRGGRASTRGR